MGFDAGNTAAAFVVEGQGVFAVHMLFECGMHAAFYFLVRGKHQYLVRYLGEEVMDQRLTVRTIQSPTAHREAETAKAHRG